MDTTTTRKDVEPPKAESSVEPVAGSDALAELDRSLDEAEALFAPKRPKPPDDDREFTLGELKAELRKFAFKYHRPCRGRGYRMVEGKLEGCSCSEKRMRRHLEQDAEARNGR